MNKLNLFFIIISLLIATNCKLGGERDTGNDQQNIGGGGNSGNDGNSGDDGSPGDGGSNGCTSGQSYYNPPGEEPSAEPPSKFIILAHGRSGTNIHDPIFNTPSWSSNLDKGLIGINGPEQAKFMTDYRFKVRVTVLKSEYEQSSADNHGDKCSWMPLIYDRLKFKIGIKDMPGSAMKAANIREPSPVDGIPIGGMTDVLNFGSLGTGDPIILEIFDVFDDSTCKSLRGYHSDPNYSCNQEFLGTNYRDCFKMQVEVATDSTMDFCE